MNYRTIQDRVLVEPLFSELMSTAGIYLGEGEMNYQGTVLAVGPKVVDVQVGDHVHFDQEAGHQTKGGKLKILVLRESNIWAVKDDSPAA